MKKIIVLAFTFLLAIPSVKAEPVKETGFAVGLRDTHHVYGTYTPVRNLDILLEHSLYVEKPGFQRVGVGVRYGMPFAKGFRWNVSAFGATTWNGNYQVVSGRAGLAYDFKRLGLVAAVNPYYDSGLGYTTAWMAGASLRIIDSIRIKAAYTTIPEYRVSERRMRGGLEFSSGRLSVSPELSVGLKRGTYLMNLRVLMSMNYHF